MRDNFSNPNPFLNQAKNYQDLVNQPHWAEPLAESLRQLGNQPAKGPQQRMANAMMGGFASGIQGAVNKERQDRLSPILEQAGQITAKAAELEAQSQQERQRVFTGTKFVRDNITRLMALGEGSMARDALGTQGVARELGREYQKAFGLNLGEFDNYDVNSRRIFYAKDGVVTGYSIPDILREYATEAFGEQAPYVMRTLDPYSKNIWENTQAIQQAELAQKQSSAKMNNAHADLFKAETDKTRHEMDNPEKPYNKEVANHNLNHIKEQRENKINAEALVSTLNDLETLIKEANKKGQAGSTLNATAQRTWAKYISGDNESATLADMAKAAYFARVKEAGGSNPSTKEFLTVLETVPNVDKNPQAALKRVAFDREQALKVIYRYKKTEEGLRKSNYQGSPDDESVFKHDDNEYKTFSKQYYTPKVTIQAPDGTIASVSEDHVDELVKKGGKIINE
jgi:hypothetical protein